VRGLRWRGAWRRAQLSFSGNMRFNPIPKRRTGGKRTGGFGKKGQGKTEEEGAGRKGREKERKALLKED